MSNEPNPGLGRRGERAALEARATMVTPSVGQCRKTRRNNLRVARIEARAKAREEARVEVSQQRLTTAYERMLAEEAQS